jgi:hypothetical protein
MLLYVFWLPCIEDLARIARVLTMLTASCRCALTARRLLFIACRGKWPEHSARLYEELSPAVQKAIHGEKGGAPAGGAGARSAFCPWLDSPARLHRSCFPFRLSRSAKSAVAAGGAGAKAGGLKRPRPAAAFAAADKG